MYNVSFVNVNITLICKNILYISKSNVALCSIYHYNTLSICICCIKIHRPVVPQCNNSCHCRSHILCYMILFYTLQISKCNACQRYEKIKTVTPKLTPIMIVAPNHMVGMNLVGRPCNVKSTDVILTQCNVDYCQCTQELILIFML